VNGPELARASRLCLLFGVVACSGAIETTKGAAPADAGAAHVRDVGEDAGQRAAAAGTGAHDASDANAAAGKPGGADPPFERPNTADGYTPEAGNCGFDKPAFCDGFERVTAGGGRAGELDPRRWSGVRGGPWDHPDLDTAFVIGPARLPACRAGLPPTVLPDADALICDPLTGIPTRHLLISAAAQNYGLTTYRIRQPIDFAGRTGTIKFDAVLVNNGLGGWPAISISEDPAPAPSFDWEERGSGPRNGLEIEFSGGWCNNPNTLELGLYTFTDYVQTAFRPSFDCDTPHATVAADRFNHVEIYVARDKLEVWVSEPSADGRSFGELKRLLAHDLALPFSRGYVSLIVRNHATLKYWQGSAAFTRFDNVGFDGPSLSDTREFSAPDSLTVTHGLDGCTIAGACLWRGDVIADHPGDSSLCTPDNACRFDGEGRNVGYVVPNPDEQPVAITIPDVVLAGATRARLAFAATYPWFDWNGVSMPPTAITLRYRLNEGSWHERAIDEIEANAFRDFSPDLGGAGHGAGLLNQIVELDLAELRDGENHLELQGKGTWTGAYRIGVTGLDLILNTGR
jgi:hypothetical protein